MISNTQSITLSCSAERVFDFVSRPENLPQWATGFCRRIRREAEGWIAETPQGEIAVELVTEPEHGVVDYHLSPAPGVCAVAPSRVVANGEGAEYIFTQFRAPNMPAEIFDRQVETLREELQQLKQILEP